jgi:hypothetical protein
MIGQATPTDAPSDVPIVDVSGQTAVWLIVGISIALALAWAIPLYLNERRAYKAFRKLQDPLIHKMLDSAASEESKLQLTEAELDKLVDAATARFESTTGLTRALMAFAIISVLGVALVAVLLSGADDASDLRKTIITALLSILATIVGFYFGAKTAEAGVAQTRQAETTGQQPKGQEGDKDISGSEGGRPPATGVPKGTP